MIAVYWNTKPFPSRMMTFLESLNELAIYGSIYYMIVFTHWIPDVEVRYSLGWFYLPSAAIVIGINIACVIYDMFYGLYLKYRQGKVKKKLAMKLKSLF